MNELKQKRIVSVIADSFVIGLISYGLGLCLALFDISMYTQISVMLFYFLFACKDCYKGMSLGKYIFKIQVVDNKTLKTANPLKCVIRNYLLFAWVIELFMMLYSTQGRRMGDILTNTKVVPFKKQQSQFNLKSIILVVVLVFVLSAFLLFVVKLRFA